MLTGCSSSEPELHVFTWSNYLTQEQFENFEKEHKCKVILNTFDSNETMYAKLSLGGGGYDVITPSHYFIELMAEQNMLDSLDKINIPNSDYLDPAYLKLLSKPILEYAVPYTVTTTVIGYRKDKVQIGDASWGIFGRQSLKGRMTMLNDPREAIGAALKYLGYSINTKDESEIAKAEKVLIKWKQNLAKFESEYYKNGLASAEYIVSQGFSGDIQLAANENPNIGIALPREGTIISYDMLAISKDSTNKALALAFINYLLKPEVAIGTLYTTQMMPPNTGVYKILPEQYKNNPIFFPPKAIIEKSELIMNLGQDNKLYNAAWDRVKAAN